MEHPLSPVTLWKLMTNHAVLIGDLVREFLQFLCFRFFLWRFDPIPGHDVPLHGFTFTLIGHTTLSRTPLDD
jgi:hypothetical protein